MINVKINGSDHQFEAGATVEDLLVKLEVRRDFLAVEQNRTILPRTKFKETLLAEDDAFEIVSLVGGG